MNDASLHFADTEPMLRAGDELAMADTQPMPLMREMAPSRPAADPIGLSLAPVEAGEYELMAETRRDHRVCPLPTRWLEFYRLLQDAAKGVPLPAPPLSGSAWAASPAAAKRACFEEQARWAVRNGCLTAAYDFLQGLPKSEWYYGN